MVVGGFGARRTARLVCSVIALTAASLPGVARATEDDLRSIAGMQHHTRVLLVFAPTLADPRLKAQQRDFSRAALQASERDLVLVQVGGEAVIGAHDQADALRAKFKVPAGAYRTLLIGKDGAVAMTADGPVPAARIMGAIDAMPMRQEELRRAREGRADPKN